MSQNHIHLTIWRIAAPMILANVSTPLLGMVDTAVMGHLKSPKYLGAIAIGSMIFTFLFWSFGFLRMATTGQTAQAYGSNNNERMNQVLAQAITLALGIGLVLLIIQFPLRIISFELVSASNTVKQLAQGYFNMRIWSAPATLVNYAILGWLIGRERPRQALIIVLLVNISNALLDLLFVYVFGMKANGVALASVFAEYLGMMLGFCLLSSQGFHWQHLMKLKLNLHFADQDWQIHANFMLRTLCLIFGFAFFTTQGARQGDLILAANTVLLNFITFTAFVLDGFANATEVLSGKAIGRRDYLALRQALKICCLWSVQAAVGFSLMYLIAGKTIVALLTDIDSVRKTAAPYLPWLIAAPLVGVWSYLLDGLFIGATRSTEIRNSMLFATFCCYLPAWYFLQPLHNNGLWLALLIFLAARALAQLYFLPRILSSTSH